MAQNISVASINNDGFMNLLIGMCELAHEDIKPKTYNLNMTKRRSFLDTMNRYKEDKENAASAADWLLYMKDVFVN